MSIFSDIADTIRDIGREASRRANEQAGKRSSADQSRAAQGGRQQSSSKPGITGAQVSGSQQQQQAPQASYGSRQYGSGQTRSAQQAAATPTYEDQEIHRIPASQTSSEKKKNRHDSGLGDNDDAIAPPITINPSSRAEYIDADDVVAKTDQGKTGKKNLARGAMTFAEANARAQRTIQNANQLTPEEVEYEPAEAPFLYNRQLQEQASRQRKSNRKKRSGLGRGLAETLTDEQKRELRSEALADYLDATRQAQDDYAARKQSAVDDARMRRGRMIADAMGQLNGDIRSRSNEILENSQILNDGARRLMPGQMELIGTSQEELDALGLGDLLPPMTRYDGIPGEEYVKPGDEPYLTYARRDDTSDDDALDWLSRKVDQEVSDRVSVFMEQADDDELTSFRDMANGVKPSEIGSKNERAQRKRESRVQTQMSWLNPLRMFRDLFKAETMEDQGFEYVTATMDKETMNAINNVSVAYNGLSINSCLKLVMARGGIAYDNFGKMKPDIRNEVVIELCKDIIDSERMNGLPNNMVTGKAYDRNVRDDKGHLVLGGTRCFPFGYIPNDVMDEIMSIPGNKLSSMTKEQVRKLEWETFVNETYPAIFANADKAQLLSYQNGMTALLELDGQNPNYFDIPMDDELTIQQQFADVKDIDDPSVNRGTVVTAAATHRAAQKAEAKYKHTPHTRMSGSVDSNKNGHNISVLMENSSNALENVFRSGSNYVRANSAENLFVMASGIPENALAAAENWEVNWFGRLNMERLERRGIDMSEYLPTDYLVSWVRSSAGREAMDVMNMLYHLDGMGYDMVAMYQEKGYGLNKSDLSKFIQELRGMEGKIADFNAFMSNLEHFWSKFTLGEGLFQGSDAQQWCITTLQLMAEAQARGGGAGVLNAKQMEDAISSGGIEQFMTDMMFNSEIARDAFMFVGLNSFNAKNPYSHAVERIFKANGYGQAFFTAFINKFPTYGVNAIAQRFPLFNSVSYIVNTLSAEIMDAAGFSNAALNLRNYQAGARAAIDAEGNFDLHGWLDGLRRNFMYDAVHHGNKMMLTCCIYTAIGALGGLGLPDDKDKYGVMEEYRIGGANGIPIKYAWWLDDIMGLSAPSAYALWLRDHGAYDRQGNWHEVSSKDYTNVFWNGSISQINGTSVFATLEMLRDLDANMELITQMMTDPEGYAASIENSDSAMPGSPSEAMHAFVEHYLVANLLRDATPTLVRQLLPMSRSFIFRDPDSDAHTAWSVWDTDATAWNPSGKTKQEAMNTLDTKSVGYLEGRRRQDSQDNPLYALLNNLFRNHWGPIDVLNGGANRQETGYFYDEQAIGTKTDDRAMMFLDMFYLDPMNDGTFVDENGKPILDEGERRTRLNEKALDVIDYMTQNYRNADEAVANGFVLPVGARINAGDYCWFMYNKVKDEWESMEGRVSNDEYWRFYKENVKPAYKQYITDLYYGWHLGRNDDTIPSTAPKYVRQESDYMDYYVDENGEAANWIDYIRGNATRKTYAFGNPNSDLMPFTTPRTEGKGFNYETIPYFDVPGYTNYGRLADELRGHSVRYGLNKNEDLEQVYFGGQPDGSLSIPTDGSMQTTIDLRNYRKSNLTEIPEVLRDATKESIEKFLGIKTNLPFDDDNDDKGDSDGQQSNNNNSGGGGRYRYYGSRRRYSYGGGGGGGYSSYNPRIYSSPRQVYSQRASGLSTRSPYRATSTYLRPAFYTSGSRKSYRRQN